MSRQISQEHLNEYKKGKLQKLFNVVRKDPDLSFEIRRDDTVSIYFRKKRLLEISYKKKNKISPFNFILLADGYAKTTEEKDYLKKLKIGFEENMEYTLKHQCELESFFYKAKQIMYRHSMAEEFHIQQNIATGHNSFDNNNRFLVVDMEYCWPQADIPQKERTKKRTRIDLILIDKQPNNDDENDIYLAELKVSDKATDGSSGTIEHVYKTAELIKREKACKDLKEDVINIIRQKIELGIISDKNGHSQTMKLAEKPKMMLILAYQGEDEKCYMEEQKEKACKVAKELGIPEPYCVLLDVLFSLN